MPGTYHIEIKGDQEVVSGFDRMAMSVMPELLASMQDAAQEAEDTMKSNIPTRTGSLEASIGSTVIGAGTEVTARIGPNDSNFGGRAVGAGTEMGKTAGGGFPNWFDIANRYGVSLGVGYAIAKKIHESGSRGLFYAEKTMASMQELFLDRGIQAVRVIGSKF